VIAGDACGDYEQERHRNTLRKMDLSFGTVVDVAGITAHWRAAPAGSAPRTAP